MFRSCIVFFSIYALMIYNNCKSWDFESVSALWVKHSFSTDRNLQNKDSKTNCFECFVLSKLAKLEYFSTYRTWNKLPWKWKSTISVQGQSLFTIQHWYRPPELPLAPALFVAGVVPCKERHASPRHQDRRPLRASWFCANSNPEGSPLKI
jgi:hypothetical protein